MLEVQEVPEVPQSRWESFKTGVSAAKTNAHKKITDCPDDIYEIVDEVVKEYENKDVKDILTENDISVLAHNKKYKKLHDYLEYDNLRHTENKTIKDYKTGLPPAVSYESKEGLTKDIYDNINSEDKTNLFKKIYILALLIKSDVGKMQYERLGFDFLKHYSSSITVYYNITKPTFIFKEMCYIYKTNFDLSKSKNSSIVKDPEEGEEKMPGNDDHDERGGAKRKSKKRSKKRRKTKRRRHTRR